MKKRNTGIIRLAKKNENGTLDLVNTEDFLTLEDAKRYLRNSKVESKEELVILKLMGEVSLKPETKTVLEFNGF